jgi:hypothetical protein
VRIARHSVTAFCTTGHTHTHTHTHTLPGRGRRGDVPRGAHRSAPPQDR